MDAVRELRESTLGVEVLPPEILHSLTELWVLGEVFIALDEPNDLFIFGLICSPHLKGECLH